VSANASCPYNGCKMVVVVVVVMVVVVVVVKVVAIVDAVVIISVEVHPVHIEHATYPRKVLS